ncbi:translation initiation factor eIF4e [Trichoderma citrinoviride]|uniref:Translation initiation factor eIF4e n=1 Tax=Trichoderma citrinoviride TaxID=58853 RepID=A0A2T4B0M0_9HYPO|nr:translation initiation factor eIF4e [Trichoderma citrinoviride]PTB62866.1 translation initiation factor eIF4e [Trichoderma citrinoviride]
MATRPQLFTRGLSGLSQSSSAGDISSPAEQRDDAKRNLFKTMRPLPTQHYWDVYFDRGSGSGQEYTAQLEKIGAPIESVQDFWRYNNNTPVENIKMRESLYLFKSGFRPVWEDRRNINGGSWTFRVPKAIGPDFWTRIQLLAIGEKLQSVIDEADQICGVGLSVRFNSHLITVWHRDSSKQNSIDAIIKCILEELPPELQPKQDNYFYKKHSDHAGFKAPPELQAVLDSQKRNAAAAAASAASADAPAVTVEPPAQ